jgi:hypothetical protein
MEVNGTPLTRWPNMSRLVSIDKLSAEQRAKLVAASQEARPSEEYRIQFAALAQRRLKPRADKAPLKPRISKTAS